MSVFERLWKDTMDVYRNTETTVNDVTVNSEALCLSSQKCHYSGGSLADTGENGVPVLINSHTLFCGLNTAIKGDRVVVTQHRSGAKISLRVGEGFPYGGGMQYSVKLEGEAA